MRQEHVAEFEFPGIRTYVAQALCFAPVERDDADRGSIEINHEVARTSTGRVRHRLLELVTRSVSTKVGAHLWRGEQLDHG
jgi:hypothetical protein